MQTYSNGRQWAGILVFTAGILLGLGLTAASTWANLEADFYGFQHLASDHLDGVSCPPLMTPHETGLVRVQAHNPSPKTVEPIYRIDTSSSLAPETRQEQFVLEPGASRELTQPLTAANLDLGFFIFAKVYRYPAYPLPSAEAACGSLVLDLPWLTGEQIYALWLTLSLVAIPLGLWLWNPSGPPTATKTQNAAQALALLTLAGLLVSAWAAWLAGVLILALSLLLAAVTLFVAGQK
jgi:hypothetical protein